MVVDIAGKLSSYFTLDYLKLQAEVMKYPHTGLCYCRIIGAISIHSSNQVTLC